MAQRILIVDDDPEFVEAVKNVLETKDYAVDSAPNGKIAVAKAREQTPNLVLLDVMMTTPSEGLDVARKMHKDDKLRGIPIIMVTGVRKEMNLPFGFEPDEEWLPVKGILEKPVRPETLLRTVADALK